MGLISFFVFLWIFNQLQAPAWCYVLVAIGLTIKVISFAFKQINRD